MSHPDEHLEVLRGMWGELRSLNALATETNARLAQLGECLGARVDRLSDIFGARIGRLELQHGEMEIQIVTELVAGNSTLRELLAAVRSTREEEERGQLLRLERRIEALEKKRDG
ncbi:MAG TPA: hypothetical protein VM925_22465 [Labilithrix sp.]|nr:hypothetical protein [Labilithrix sp.]